MVSDACYHKSSMVYTDTVMLTTQQSRTVHMGGSRRDGKASGYANALRSHHPAEGASVAPEDSEAGKARYMGKGARESTFSSTHYQQTRTGNTVRTHRGAGWEREPDDTGSTASCHVEGGLLESRVRCKPHARFGGGDGGNGLVETAPCPYPTRTAHSTGSVAGGGRYRCGPQLTAGVRPKFHRSGKEVCPG